MTKSSMAKAKAKGKIKRIQGRGAYNFADTIKNIGRKIDNVASKIPKGTFRTIGSAFGPKGAALGQAISTITGYGSYNVDHNTIMTSTQIGAAAENIPTFSKGSHGSTITHREFIRNVIVPNDGNEFQNTVERLAIDNANIFPWLSKLSTRYQRYKVKGMVFQYRSISTDYNNSGSVAIAVNYNATERGYTNMPALLNSQFACSAKPSVSFYAPVECDPKTHPDGFYIRHEDEINNMTDVRMSSVGVLNVATQGLSLNQGTVLGELWVTYEIELIAPYLGNNHDVDVNTLSVIKTVNTLDGNWSLVQPTDGSPDNPPFVQTSSYPVEGAELTVAAFVLDSNVSRPVITASFQTGERTYVIEMIAYRNLTVDWQGTPSTTQPPNPATILYQTTFDQTGSGAITIGSYIHRAVVKFKPGQTFSPFTVGIQAAAASTYVIVDLSIIRSGNSM